MVCWINELSTLHFVYISNSLSLYNGHHQSSLFYSFFIQVIAIVMDIFTDVDIFKEIVDASTRGISVYLLLDDSNFSHFFKMAEKQGCQVQRLRVSNFVCKRAKYSLLIYSRLIDGDFNCRTTGQDEYLEVKARKSFRLASE